MIEFEFDLVGGGFDGVPGLSWRGDAKHPCPETILVGICAKTQNCGMAACRPGKRHVAFWTPDEKDAPVGAQAYEKQDEFVERGEDDELHGRAVYAIGGLLDPRNFGAAARTPAGCGGGGDPVDVTLAPGRRELLPAGRHDRGWPR